MPDLARIMLVEDGEDDYEATIRSFERNRVLNPVRWCRSGQEALDCLYGRGAFAAEPAPTRTDLILLDLNMPGLDGRFVLQAIKKDPALRSIPVIILTTSVDDHDIEKCYDIGANSYIQKPLHFDGLVEAVRRMKEYWIGLSILPAQSTAQ